MASTEDYTDLRYEAKSLASMKLDLQTVIPQVLDPTLYPRRDSKGGLVVNKQTGEPEPAYSGRNPSFWNANNNPIKAKPNEPCTLQEVLNRIEVAEKLNKPLGIGVIPREPIIVIDIDQKRYASREEMTTELWRIFNKNQDLRSTRIEKTPSGGRHIWVEVNDLSEWKNSGNGWHCNFSTEIGGPHRGEILTGGSRFCISAPTKRFDGNYEFSIPECKHKILKINTLSELGIYPSVQKPNLSEKSKIFLPPAAYQHSANNQKIKGSEEQLYRLMSENSKRVLQGELAFSADDRSGTLTAFANELNSWKNHATEYGVDFEDAVDFYWEEAVETLDCRDKAERIKQTLDTSCQFANTDWADKRFREVCEIELASPFCHVGGGGSDHQNYQNVADGDDMSIDDALNELIRIASEGNIDAKEMLPPYLEEGLSIIRETIKYSWETLLAVLMVAVSGAMPLESKITLIPGDFVQPCNLFVVLLMSTGELKSPLVKRMIIDPWKSSVDEVINRRHNNATKQWKQLKSEARAAGEDYEISQPSKAQTLITEDMTVQGVERHFVLHERYAKGSIFLLIDEGKEMLAEMSGKSSTTNQLKIGPWILSRYDGTGGRGAKANEQLERHYSQCRFAALFCCQPEVYRSITGDADQTGLAARFLAVEQNKVDQIFPAEFDASHHKRHNDLNRILGELYTFACDRDSVTLILTDEARVLFQQERQNLQDKKNQTLSDAERGLLNKCHGRIGRIAAILHIIWSYDPKQPAAREITQAVGVETMQRAIKINRHLLSQSLLVRQTSAGNSGSMRKINAFQNRALKVNKPKRITELRKDMNSANRLSSSEAEQVAKALHETRYGSVSLDDAGKLCYQAFKPLGT